MFRKIFLVMALVTVLLSAGLSLASTAPPAEGGITLTEALEKLMLGNENFVNGTLTSVGPMSSPAVRHEVATFGQKPYAIVLDCSDSRLPPELIFDKGLGELFVVRVAGNIIAPHQIASIEYAIEHLGAKLIMVLGHERCGAVNAAYGSFGAKNEILDQTEYDKLSYDLKILVETIRPTVVETKQAAGSANDCVLNNVQNVTAELKTKSEVISKILRTTPDELMIVKAFYDLDDGHVTLLDGSKAIYTVKSSVSSLDEAGKPVGGKILPSGDSGVVAGRDQSYLIVAEPGYAVASINVDGTEFPGSHTSYTFNNVGGNHSISVQFVPYLGQLAAPATIWVRPNSLNGETAVSWGAVSSAVTYILEESTGKGFDPAETKVVYTGSATSVAIQAHLNGSYYYRVKATAASYTDSEWKYGTNPCNVSRTAAAPTSIWVRPASANGETAVSWGLSSTPGASYVVEESTDNLFSTPTVVYNGSTNLVKLPGHANGSYYYRVKAIADGFNESTWKTGLIPCVVTRP